MISYHDIFPMWYDQNLYLFIYLLEWRLASYMDSIIFFS